MPCVTFLLCQIPDSSAKYVWGRHRARASLQHFATCSTHALTAEQCTHCRNVVMASFNDVSRPLQALQRQMTSSIGRPPSWGERPWLLLHAYRTSSACYCAGIMCLMLTD